MQGETTPRITRNKYAKSAGRAAIILNIISAGLGILYLARLALPLLWDVFGILLLVTFFLNLLVLYLLDKIIDKTTVIGKRLNWWSFGVLILIIFAMYAIVGANFLISVTYSNALGAIGGYYLVIYCSYFGLLAMGVGMGYATMNYSRWEKGVRNVRSGSDNASIKNSPFMRFVRTVLILTCILFLANGVYLCVVTLAGTQMGVQPGAELGLREGASTSEYITIVMQFLPGVIGLVAAPFGGFWVIIMLSIAILLLKLTRRRHSARLSRSIGILGLAISGILLLPVILIPSGAAGAEQSFTQAFGADWRTRISPAVEVYFSPEPVELPGYYLGVPPKDCIVLKDVSFYNGTSGVDAGKTLYFDAYLPPNGGIGLPGANSTLIRIHGGGWTLGTKGVFNMMQVNKYFAAQGYVVFDIEYGLNDFTKRFLPFSFDWLQPSHLMGNFTVEDMLRHIGLFCQYLVVHQAQYGVNLSSVFISGGSAGGHLTCAAALDIANGNYTSWFGTTLQIKGFIPFYPGNEMPQFFDQTSSPTQINPALLVNLTSPPCLIFQGTEDGLANPTRTQALKDAYVAASNDKCALIWLPLSGHAGDFYFSGYYNQLCLYYMERFLYLFR